MTWSASTNEDMSNCGEKGAPADDSPQHKNKFLADAPHEESGPTGPTQSRCACQHRARHMHQLVSLANATFIEESAPTGSTQSMHTSMPGAARQACMLPSWCTKLIRPRFSALAGLRTSRFARPSTLWPSTSELASPSPAWWLPPAVYSASDEHTALSLGSEGTHRCLALRGEFLASAIDEHTARRRCSDMSARTDSHQWGRTSIHDRIFQLRFVLHESMLPINVERACQLGKRVLS